ncbi:MAG: hypothetical protein AAF471_00080 [Myxococcota bacterium]
MPKRIAWPQLMVALTLTAMLGWLWSDRLDGLFYHFSRNKLVDVGSVLKTSRDRYTDLAGKYIQLNGVLGSRAANMSGLHPNSLRIDAVQIRQMMGSPVFVLFNPTNHPDYQKAFMQVTVRGRLIRLDPKGPLKQLHAFFQRHSRRMPDQAYVLLADEQPWSGFGWRYPPGLLVSLLLIMFSFMRALR